MPMRGQWTIASFKSQWSPAGGAASAAELLLSTVQVSVLWSCSYTHKEKSSAMQKTMWCKDSSLVQFLTVWATDWNNHFSSNETFYYYQSCLNQFCVLIQTCTSESRITQVVMNVVVARSWKDGRQQRQRSTPRQRSIKNSHFID